MILNCLFDSDFSKFNIILQLKMKYLYKLFICVAVLCFVKCNEVEEVTVHLELLEMDLADYCSNLSAAERDILFKKPNAYKQKVKYKLTLRF